MTAVFAQNKSHHRVENCEDFKERNAQAKAERGLPSQVTSIADPIVLNTNSE